MQIAVIGLSCRLPKAPDPHLFWQLLRKGATAISETPRERWDVDSLCTHDLASSEKATTRWGGFLDQIDSFDAAFFSLSPHETMMMDPQQRLMLELCWEALEDAGIIPERLRKSQTGVFVGAISHDYASLFSLQGRDAITPYTLTGLHRSMIANRISYVLGAQGPSFTIDAGQSSSLVAVHLAIESLRRGEATLALVGGVHLNLIPESAIQVSQLGALSPDGCCFTFDARANGYVRGEGGVALVLKPLSQAVADGNTVYCVLLGSAINNDGAGSSLVVPNALAQEEVLRNAYRRAGVELAGVQYVELHGTGTKVGDPIEAAALGVVFGPARTTENPLLVGSVKTNVGHLEGAAGITGLLKTILAMKEREIPPSLNFEVPNPQIAFDTLHLRIPTSLSAWPCTDQPLIAGVSSFGIGGTNCHVVLSEWLQPTNNSRATGTISGNQLKRPFAWVVSGKTVAALRAQAQRLLEHIVAHPELGLADVGYSLAISRTNFAQRGGVVSTDRAGFLAGLEALAQGEAASHVVEGMATDRCKAVFVFPGQGHQWAGMARELLDTSAVFREQIAACDAVLASYVTWSVEAVLRQQEGTPSLDRVDVVQPVLFAVMVALAGMWRFYGVEPAAVVGHSQGEIAAACVAGALSLSDGARLVALRSQALTAMAGRGGMISVSLSEHAVAERLARWGKRISIAVVNSPCSVVVAGEPQALEELLEECQQAEISARRLPVDYASHSAHMEEIQAELEQLLQGITPQAGEVPFYSSVTGDVLESRALDSAYWYRNLRQPVRFAQVMERLLQDGHKIFVEVSAHPILLSGMQETAEATNASDVVVQGTLKRGEGDMECFLTALVELYVHGGTLDWEKVFEGYDAQRVKLPTYAFQRQRYWLDTVPTMTEDETSIGLRVTKQQLALLSEAEQEAVLIKLVRTETATMLGYADSSMIEIGRAFKELGFDSLAALGLRSSLRLATGLPLPATLIFDYPTPAVLAHYLRSEFFSDFKGVTHAPHAQKNVQEITPNDMIDMMDVADLLQMVKNRGIDGYIY